MRDIKAIRAQIAHNPDAVLQVWPTFTPNALDDPRDELLWGWNESGREIVLRLGRYPLHFKAESGDPEVIERAPSLIIVPGRQPPIEMKHWGMTKLDDHTWGVTPSIHLPGAFHGYVTLCGAPDPAPWEAR